MEKQITAIALTGDWLVTRGYHATDDLVSTMTGIPLSHAAVYDAVSGSVIEAEGQGVHMATLFDFIDKSHRILVIRPRWRTEVTGPLAWQEARKLVGRDYDYLGTIGFDMPSRYYCSELAIAVYAQWLDVREHFPTVIKPGELYLYGQVLYDSLPRDENPRLQR